MTTQTETAVALLMERLRIAYPKAWRVRFEVEGSREETRRKIKEAAADYCAVLEPLNFKMNDVAEVMPIITRYHKKWIPKPYVVAGHVREARRWQQRQAAEHAQRKAEEHVTPEQVEQCKKTIKKLVGLVAARG